MWNLEEALNEKKAKKISNENLEQSKQDYIKNNLAKQLNFVQKNNQEKKNKSTAKLFSLKNVKEDFDSKPSLNFKQRNKYKKNKLTIDKINENLKK